MSDIKIRPLMHDDRAVWEEMLMDYYPPLHNRLNSSWGSAMGGDVNWNLAELDGVVVGFIAIVFHVTAFSKGEIIYLSDLYVRPEARRKGVAQAMMEGMIYTGKQLGVEKIYWLTEYKNVAAQQLYRKYAVSDFMKFHVNL